MHEFAGHQIRMRKSDGYLSATDMVKTKPGKKLNDYLRSNDSKEYIKALEDDLKISNEKCDTEIYASLIDVKKGNSSAYEQGTYVHPRVAIHLAQWISPKFSVQVTDWVLRFMKGDLSLVADIVNQHDLVNNTKSEVFIDTKSKALELQLQETKLEVINLRKQVELIPKLENSIKQLCDEKIRLKSLTCKYCNKTYSANSCITKHCNNHCEEKNKALFIAVIDIDKLKAYVDVLIDNTPDFNNKFKFNIRRYYWNTSKPIIRVFSPKHTFSYLISENHMRFKFLKFIDKVRHIPINVLLDKSSKCMLENNKLNIPLYITV